MKKANQVSILLITCLVLWSNAAGICKGEDQGVASEESTSDLLKELESKDKLRKIRAIDLLGKRLDEVAIPKLIEKVNDPDRVVRIQAIKVLGKMKAEDAVDILHEKMKKKLEHWMVRLNAAESLGAIGKSRSLVHLIGYLKETCEMETMTLEPPIRKSFGSDKFVLESRITNAIIELGRERAISSAELEKHLDGEEGLSDFKFFISRVLAKNKSKKVVPVLIQYLGSSKDGLVRSEAARLLGDLGDKRAVEPLKKALDDDYVCISMGDVDKNYGYIVRNAVAQSLRKLGVNTRKNGNKFEIIKPDE